jgi:hypothetical protein
VSLLQDAHAHSGSADVRRHRCRHTAFERVWPASGIRVPSGLSDKEILAALQLLNKLKLQLKALQAKEQE